MFHFLYNSIYIYTGNLLIIVKKYGGKKYQINYNVIIILALNDTLESLKVDLHLKKIKVTLVNDSRVEVEDEVFFTFQCNIAVGDGSSFTFRHPD